ncbi:MAG: phosphoribosylglycinamide formyltransferase [Bacteroidales bacterium]|nr:phosphoribosylglycinamide formyltransferase [Bacteroidales bacterium]
MKIIAIFASGNGTNAQRIMEYFSGSSQIKISLILSNKNDAYVLERAKNFKIESCVFDKSAFYESNKIIDILSDHNIDLIVLAGFLWLIPISLINKYKDKIINIHPALLPKYGGKGMYGMRVHQAVLEAKEKESGISIHYVNEFYDDGKIVFQSKCKVYPSDSPETLAERIHKLEHKHFAPVIEKLLMGKL